MSSEKTKVLLCGGGNAIHVLTSYIGSKDNCEVNILSLFPGEADRLRDNIPMMEEGKNGGIKCINDLGQGDIYGKPNVISNDPSIVATNVDVIILALPSFTHQMYLEALKPYIKPGCTVGSMPGEGGFDLCCRHVLGDELVTQINIYALETLPWACRIVEYGRTVEVLGTKQEIDIVIRPAFDKGASSSTSKEQVLELFQNLIGRLPKLVPACNFLAVTLMNINSVWHPTISYCYYHDKDVTVPMDEPPLFYQGATEFTGEKLDLVSNEVLNLGKVLKEKYPTLDLSSLYHVRDWMLRSYGDDIGDKTNIYTMLISNKGYRGLTHPTREVQVDGKTKYLPNFKYRYFSEDIPCGLIVTRGIAELAGVATPHMDDVIMWCQSVMDKEYLVNGKLVGKDLNSTRCPQQYGEHNLDAFMKDNHYI